MVIATKNPLSNIDRLEKHIIPFNKGPQMNYNSKYLTPGQHSPSKNQGDRLIAVKILNKIKVALKKSNP